MGKVKYVQKKDFKKRLKDVVNHWQLYVMALPAVVLLFMFAYLPMGGLVIAFKNYRFRDGILGSDWADPIYRNFQILFNNNAAAVNAMRNTILLNLLFIIVGTAFALVLTLTLNEIRHVLVKRVCQSITFLPHFISWVVVGVFASGFLAFETGVINRMLAALGFDRIGFYMEPSYWPAILLFIVIWRGAGLSAIIYLAAITGIDETFYEAARIDGGTRLQQIWYITLPLLRPTVIILTLLAVGRIMNADFGLFYNVTQNMPILHSTTDVLDTYIFRALRQTGNVAIASATGFFQSVVGFGMILLMNGIARRYERDSALF